MPDRRRWARGGVSFGAAAPCHFFLQQHVQTYVSQLYMTTEVRQALRAVFTAPNRAEAEQLLKLPIGTCAKTAPKHSAWRKANAPVGLTVFAWPIDR